MEDSKVNSQDIESTLDIDSLLHSITESLSNPENSTSLKDFRSNDINEFSIKLQGFQEIFRNILNILRKHPVNNHQYLWVYLVSIFSSDILDLKTYYVNNFVGKVTTDKDATVYQQVAINLRKSSEDLDRVIYQFFCGEEYKVENLLKSPKISSKLLDLVVQILNIIVIDQVSEVKLSNMSFNTLGCIDNFIKLFFTFLSSLEKHKKRQHIYNTFSMLTTYLKAIYYSGESCLLKTLLEFEDPIIYPKLGIEIINTGSVNFIEILDFYRFTAFNLLILSLSDDERILSQYNLEANKYFISLFNIPNLSTDSYISWEDDNIPRERIVSQTERQEISLMYILNYLLSLSDLTQLVNAQKYFLDELSFLIRSLSSSLSSDIRTASISGVSLSSYSISQMQFNQQGSSITLNEDTQFNFLSSIITNGTYKEKHLFIVKFCEILNQKLIDIPHIIKEYSLDSCEETSFFHVYSMIESSKFPGKISHISAIHKITKLLILISIKFMFSTGGINEIEELKLRRIFKLKTSILPSLDIKNLVKYLTYLNNDGNTVVRFKLSSDEYKDKDLIVAKQLHICDVISDLEHISNNIKLSTM